MSIDNAFIFLTVGSTREARTRKGFPQIGSARKEMAAVLKYFKSKRVGRSCLVEVPKRLFLLEITKHSFDMADNLLYRSHSEDLIHNSVVIDLVRMLTMTPGQNGHPA